MKTDRRLYRSIFAVLMLAILLGIAFLAANLQHAEPVELTGQESLKITTEGKKANLEGRGRSEDRSDAEEEKKQKDRPEDEAEQEKKDKEDQKKQGEEEKKREGDQDGQGQDNNELEDRPGGSGEGGQEGGDKLPDEGPDDDSELKIITDLSNREISYTELEDDVLPFYAYIINGNDMTLKVKLRNSKTPQNGIYLHTKNNRDYEAKLARMEANFFTLYVRDGRKIVSEITYIIRYVPQKADKDNPTVGDKPPSIETNLEGVKELSNKNFTFTVKAQDYKGRRIYSSNIEVTLDGEEISNPTGGPVYEYQFKFKDVAVGDVSNHDVTVRAWDDEGNSTFISYNIDYLFVDIGDEIGTIYLILDMTTVGLGVFDEPFEYKIKQGEPASVAVVEMLHEYGFDPEYSGSLDRGFYLKRIHKGGFMDYAKVPSNLWQKVLDDGLNLTKQKYNDSLGEFDYTQGSGWMYSMGGEVYAGKSMSTYFPSNGDTIYLRFTLAYGKDIGGYVEAGAGYGKLASYCGKWINGKYIDLHKWSKGVVTKEPSCTKAGEKSQVCSVCKDKKGSVKIPALGHDFEEVDRKEPADGQDGFVLYRCGRCGKEKKEVLPWTED